MKAAASAALSKFIKNLPDEQSASRLGRKEQSRIEPTFDEIEDKRRWSEGPTKLTRPNNTANLQSFQSDSDKS